MEVSMTQAALAAMLSVLPGVFLGVFYDVIRLLRAILGVDVSNPFCKGKLTFFKLSGYIFVALGDLLFFLVAAVVMCVFLFLTGDGRMRWYVLAGSFLGFLLYYNTVGRLFINAVEKVIALLKKAFRMLLLPVACLFRMLKKLCLRFFDMPIVKAAFKRYNDYITKRKKEAAARKRRKKRKKGDCFTNGGTHGQKT